MEHDVEALQLLAEEAAELQAICVPTCMKHQQSAF
jgi:hypothetical protein